MKFFTPWYFILLSYGCTVRPISHPRIQVDRQRLFAVLTYHMKITPQFNCTTVKTFIHNLSHWLFARSPIPQTYITTFVAGTISNMSSFSNNRNTINILILLRKSYPVQTKYRILIYHWCIPPTWYPRALLIIVWILYRSPGAGDLRR